MPTGRRTQALLAWVKAEAAKHGHTWRYSVGFDVTEPVRAAYVTDITGRPACASLPPPSRCTPLPQAGPQPRHHRDT